MRPLCPSCSMPMERVPPFGILYWCELCYHLRNIYMVKAWEKPE